MALAALALVVLGAYDSYPLYFRHSNKKHSFSVEGKIFIDVFGEHRTDNVRRTGLVAFPTSQKKELIRCMESFSIEKRSQG